MSSLRRSLRFIITRILALSTIVYMNALVNYSSSSDDEEEKISVEEKRVVVDQVIMNVFVHAAVRLVNGVQCHRRNQ